MCEPIMSGENQLLPLPDTIYSSIKSCDAGLRRTLLNNILVCGGGSCIPGLRERFRKEMVVRLPETHKVRIMAPGSVEQKYSVFIGGSILSSLGSFQQMWISRQEFDESGSTIVHTKCN